MSIQKALYTSGDHRYNLYETTDNHMRKTAESIACFISQKHLSLSGENYSLTNVPTQAEDFLQSGIPLGENERYLDEPNPGYGTGFLVGKNLLLTAAHVVCKNGSNTIDSTRIYSTLLVFGFAIKNQQAIPTSFPVRDVCKIESVLAYDFARGNRWADWALLKLNKDINRPALNLGFNFSASYSSILYMSGHPNGLPLKTTTGGTLISSSSEVIQVKIDAFGGNSGSPIMCGSSVIGILCAGNEDFVLNPKYGSSQLPRYQAHHVTSDEIAQIGYEKCQKISALKFLTETLPYFDLPVFKPLFSALNTGLNFIGTCSTTNCGRVLAHVGTGTFHLGYERGQLKCPNCSSKLPTGLVDTLVLSNCRYTIEGMNPSGNLVQGSFALPSRQNDSFQLSLSNWKYVKLTINKNIEGT